MHTYGKSLQAALIPKSVPTEYKLLQFKVHVIFILAEKNLNTFNTARTSCYSVCSNASALKVGENIQNRFGKE